MPLAGRECPTPTSSAEDFPGSARPTDTMTEPTSEELSGRIVAICPDCNLELTRSKLVEQLKAHDRHHPGGYVFWCPECGRFFTREADGTTHPRS